MLKHFDHVTIVVRDVERAKTFFGALGFKQAISTVITGEPFASYMGVPGIEAEHVTLVLENAAPRTEIQLLRYRHPQALPDPNIGDLHKLGFNHVCFAVDDIEAEVAKQGQRVSHPQRDHGFPFAQASVRRGAGRRHHRALAVALTPAIERPARPPAGGARRSPATALTQLH
jgi:catechol 2,3-dioxygenase-like lactoylglutathione lyase family enzyme